MAVKLTAQGLLIYVTMAAYLLAAVATLAKRKRVGWAMFAAGFVCACVSVVFRWRQVEHVPLQNLFEVLLVLAMLMFPLSLLPRWRYRLTGQGWDMLIGAILLFPAGFVFSEQPYKLSPALQSPLFVPHVLAYMLGYVLMAKAAVQAGMSLSARYSEASLVYEEAAYRMVRLGFPMLTAGLLLGAWWGKLAWGDYWHWDPKEMWSLATWLIYVSYFHFRLASRKKHPKVASALALVGMTAIVITLLLVSLARIFAGRHAYAV